jgi:hypothetical protein
MAVLPAQTATPFSLSSSPFQTGSRIKALVLVAAAVLEARDQPSTYSSRRPGRKVPTSIDQVVSFTIATDEVIETVPPPLAS